MSRHYAIVPAAGSGARFGSQIPKQYLALAGKPLIYHTLAALCAYPRIAGVWVVVSADDAWWPQYDWRPLGEKLHVVHAGGATRAQSVGNGLAAAAAAGALADDDWVLVHDAVRPCLSAAMLDALCDELADDAVGGLLAVPVADTLKRADAQQRVSATEPRDGMWQAQTPQMFRHRLLRDALAAHGAVTDEAGRLDRAWCARTRAISR